MKREDLFKKGTVVRSTHDDYHKHLETRGFKFDVAYTD